jgi:N-acyl-D-amino-acid deacylase
MTSFPAQKLGLWKKGLMSEGMDADLVIFDVDTIAQRSTFLEAHQYPTGLPSVILNGQVVVDQERCIGKLTGQVLKRQG